MMALASPSASARTLDELSGTALAAPTLAPLLAPLAAAGGERKSVDGPTSRSSSALNPSATSLSETMFAWIMPRKDMWAR